MGWRDSAACDGADIGAFFPEGPGKVSYVAAKRYCTRCPVTVQCAQYAIDTDTQYGMFGGLTPHERLELAVSGLVAAGAVQGHGDAAGTVRGFYRERAAGVPPCDECRQAFNEQSRVNRLRRKERIAV